MNRQGKITCLYHPVVGRGSTTCLRLNTTGVSQGRSNAFASPQSVKIHDSRCIVRLVFRRPFSLAHVERIDQKRASKRDSRRARIAETASLKAFVEVREDCVVSNDTETLSGDAPAPAQHDMTIRVTLIATTTPAPCHCRFALSHGCTAVYHRIRPPLPCRKDSSPNRRPARPREDSHLTGSGTVSPMDGCQDHGRIPGRLQKEDPG